MDRDAKTKRCSVCERELPVESFYKRKDGNTSDGRPISKCKSCHKKTPEENRKRNLAKYKLTPEQVKEMFAAQGDVCAICGEVPVIRSAKKNGLAVDHDHATGLVRGILCYCCNAGLGMFKDDPARLLAAIAYLERASEVAA
jgi:hypothetical protein